MPRALAAVALVLCASGCSPRARGFDHCTPLDLSSLTLANAGDLAPHLADTCLVDTDANGQLVHHPDSVVYELQAPLFSDYTRKTRAVHLPPGQKATWSDTDAFDFPTGTAIAKTFAWVADTRDAASPQHPIETRLLVRATSGWVAVTYVWDHDGKEATLELAGRPDSFTTITPAGESHTASYFVPSAAQCGQCHETDKVQHPIGPKARQLHRTVTYPDGTVEDQLAHWAARGLLDGVPADLTTVPRLPAWDDPQAGTVADRARAWLEGNCAHCHSEGGLAKTTGLYLWASQTLNEMAGVCKTPVAAGAASGGRQWDIVPGRPDDSILVYRIESDDPSVMMPELGRSLVHAEGVKLVRDWIASMPPATPGACP